MIHKTAALIGASLLALAAAPALADDQAQLVNDWIAGGALE